MNNQTIERIHKTVVFFLLGACLALTVATIALNYKNKNKPAPVDAIVAQQDKEIKSLELQIRQRQSKLDSLSRESAKIANNIQQLRKQNQTLLYEIIKEHHRIDTMPIDGVYSELSKHIRSDYR